MNNSVSKRYFVTLGVNLFQLFAGLINSSIVPKSLGAANYGDYNFLLRTFSSVRTFLTLNTGSAFYTFSSKNIKSKHAFYIFFGWGIAQVVLIALFVSTAFIFGWTEYIFPDQQKVYIIVLGILEWINYISTSLIQFGESKAETIKIQKINLFSNVLLISLIVSLYLFGVFDYNAFIVVNYIASLFIVVFVIVFIYRNREKYFEKYDRLKLEEVYRYFVDFCKPLLVYSIFGLIFNFFDRWILQIVSGSIEQGYFSIANRWSNVVLIFTTSIQNVFWRESSFSFGQGNTERVKKILKKTFISAIFISAFFGILFFFLAKEFITVFLGEEYLNALVVVQIMAFYPIYASLGQLGTAFFYSVEKVKLHRNISIINMLFGVALAYFFTVPENFFIPGLHLGSLGIALKTFIHGMTFVAMQYYFIVKYFDGSYKEFLIKPAIIIIVLFGIASLIQYLLRTFILNNLVHICLFGFVYLLIVVLFLIKRPEVLEFTKQDLEEVKSIFIKRNN